VFEELEVYFVAKTSACTVYDIPLLFTYNAFIKRDGLRDRREVII